MSSNIRRNVRSHQYRMGQDADSLPTANLIEHLAADSITGLGDGDGIATWVADVGTNGVQGVAARRPTYKTGIKNGLPVARFDGTTDGMDLTGLTAGLGSFTFVFVIDAADANTTLEYLFDTATGRLIMAFQAGTITKMGWNDGAWKEPGIAITGWQILTFVLTSGANGEIFRNGVSLGTAAYTATAVGGATVLGAKHTAGANWFPGDIGEFLVYSDALDAATRGQTEAYLNNKWLIY